MTSTPTRAAFTGVLTGAIGVFLVFVFVAPERSAVFRWTILLHAVQLRAHYFRQV